MTDYVKHLLRHNFWLHKRMKHIHRLHEMSRTQLLSYENEAFVRLVRHAFKNSPFYRNFYRAWGVSVKDIQSIEDIVKLPITNKAIIRDNSLSILTVPKTLTVKGYTSGTSGSPLTVFRSIRSIIEENAYYWYFLNMHGLSEGDPIISMRGKLDKNQLYKFSKADNILYLSSYNVNTHQIFRYKQLIKDFKPKAILAYPSSLESLANKLDERGWKLNIPKAFTSSETLYQFQRDKVKDIIGADILDWFGNAERTIAIEECYEQKYHFVPGYGITEKRNGALLTTSLINYAFPLIRYETTDRLEWSDSQQNFILGNPSSSVVTNIDGRQDDVLILQDGTTVGRLGIAFKGIDQIRYAQIIQSCVDYIDVNVVAAREFEAGVKQKIINNLKGLIGEGISINIHLVDESDIIKTASGKYKLVINRIND